MRLRASAYLPLTNCVPLGKTLKHSEPQYPHLQRGILMNNHDCSASEGDTDEQSGRPGTEKGVRNGSCEPVLCFILWTSEIGAGRRSGPVVRAASFGGPGLMSRGCVWRAPPSQGGDPRDHPSFSEGLVKCKTSTETWAAE